MTLAELGWALLLFPVAATLAAFLSHRWPARVPVALLLAAPLALVWLRVEVLRAALLALPFGVLAMWSREGTVRLVLSILGGVGMAFGAALLLLVGVRPPPVARTLVSPDGRWELRYAPESGMRGGSGALDLAPRGLVAFDPRAYPSRTLVDFATVTTPDRIAWTGPREVTVHVLRDSDGGPLVNRDLGVRVVVEE